jgi:hypothetical protein
MKQIAGRVGPERDGRFLRVIDADVAGCLQLHGKIKVGVYLKVPVIGLIAGFG